MIYITTKIKCHILSRVKFYVRSVVRLKPINFPPPKLINFQYSNPHPKTRSPNTNQDNIHH